MVKYTTLPVVATPVPRNGVLAVSLVYEEGCLYEGTYLLPSRARR